MRHMRPLKLIILAAVAALVATAAFAQHKRSFENLWGEATAGQHALTDYGDYTMVDRGDVFWYFTKPGHDAYPGVVRRAIKQNNGRFFIDTQGWSFAAEAGPARLQALAGGVRNAQPAPDRSAGAATAVARIACLRGLPEEGRRRRDLASPEGR